MGIPLNDVGSDDYLGVATGSPDSEEEVLDTVMILYISIACLAVVCVLLGVATYLVEKNRSNRKSRGLSQKETQYDKGYGRLPDTDNSGGAPFVLSTHVMFGSMGTVPPPQQQHLPSIREEGVITSTK